MAGKLAIENGWAINVGGGFHHCSKNRGGGFCPYADITLLLYELFDEFKLIQSAMIVDLDAHQVIYHFRVLKMYSITYIRTYNLLQFYVGQRTRE